MKTMLLVSFCAYSALLAPVQAANLLQNPGFEAAGENFAGWTVKNSKDNGPPYVYLLDRTGGGHGQEGAYQGERAIEIYTSDRMTCLSQTVALTPGKYRFSGYLRNQMSGDHHANLVVKLGTQAQTIPVISMSYRLYFADFDVVQAGNFPLEMTSSQSGLALDELSLVRLDDTTPAEEPPYLLFDLLPTSCRRSRGEQPYLVGQPQWMNFTVSCLDISRLDHPWVHFYIPAGVKLSGFNELLLQAYRAPKTTDASLKVTSVTREGIAYERISFALPRFEPNKQISPIGGAWLEVSSGGKANILVELEDRGRTFPTQEILLTPVLEPVRQLTPKKILTVGYHVQSWTQSLPHRIEALPRQFKLMGLNVWSDYGVHPSHAFVDSLTPEEQVRIRAYEQYGVRNFWPNFASFFETDAGNMYSEPKDAHDPDRYVVKEDGTVDSHWYNMRYVAHSGTAWRDSVLAAFQQTPQRLQRQKLPYRYTGFINDGLEAVIVSYDPVTRQDFATKHALDPKTVTIADLKGALKDKWLAYNLGLYEQAMNNWATALRELDPQMKMIITAGSFGPIGANGPELPIALQAEWTKQVDFTMPQWYGFMRYYGSHWHDQLNTGLKEKVYGQTNGRADVIPLLSLSMDSGLEEPVTLRFKIFDLLSTSSVVKGIGYYLASNGFADGRFMVGLSEVHTLLADVEDFYAEGKKQDELARYEIEGQAKNPEIRTTVRVHTLANDNRIALLTVISHSNAGKGEKGTIILSDEFFKQHVDDRTDLAIFDHLHQNLLPFSSKIEFDTTQTSNLALLEVIRKPVESVK